MRHTLACIIVSLLVPCLHADAEPTGNQDETATIDPAEDAWRSLRAQLSRHQAARPPRQTQPADADAPVPPPGERPAQQNQPPEHPVRIDWQAVARKSREYLAQYPHSKHANDARKLELTAELVPLRGKGRVSPEIEAKVEAYLADNSIPGTERFEASAMSKEARTELRAGMTRDEVMTRYLQNARELVAEYPADPRAWTALLNSARFIPGQPGRDSLQEIVQSPAAPDDIKQAAQRQLNASALLGKPIENINLAPADGRPAMIYFWTCRKPEYSRLLHHYAKVPGIAFIGINTDEDEATARQFATQLALPGGQIYDGHEGPLWRQLCISRLPAVLLVDERGILRDIDGGFNTLEKLKQMAGNGATANPAAANEGGRQ